MNKEEHSALHQECEPGISHSRASCSNFAACLADLNQTGAGKPRRRKEDVSTSRSQEHRDPGAGEEQVIPGGVEQEHT